MCGKPENERRNMPKKTDSSTVPVMLNRKNLSEELNTSKNKIFRAYERGQLKPDARMVDGQPLFNATRIGEISQLLRKPEIFA
jgi:hypothetical protein